jgi:3-oxoadipate enol-lactonase
MPYADLNGGALFYQEAGQGQPVVLCIHGFCQSSDYWQPTIEKLGAAGARGIAPDLPGFGQSVAFAGPYTMEQYADVLASLLDAFGLERVVVAGGSMGGVIAQQFALRHPNRLERLLLVATGAFTGDPAGALKKADELIPVPWSDEMVNASVNAFFHNPPREPALTRYRETYRSASPGAAVEALRSNAGTNTFEQLGQIGVPTMIVQGRHDRSRTPERGAEMCERIPNCRLEILEHSGHTPQIDEPEAFRRVALPFLLGQA